MVEEGVRFSNLSLTVRFRHSIIHDTYETGHCHSLSFEYEHAIRNSLGSVPNDPVIAFETTDKWRAIFTRPKLSRPT